MQDYDVGLRYANEIVVKRRDGAFIKGPYVSIGPVSPKRLGRQVLGIGWPLFPWASHYMVQTRLYEATLARQRVLAFSDRWPYVPLRSVEHGV